VPLPAEVLLLSQYFYPPSPTERCLAISVGLLVRHRKAEPLLCADHVIDILGRVVDIDLHPLDLAVEVVAARPVVL
jgi:hypothetical protein